MRTLLIWDSFGEDDLRFYMIDDAPEWLAKCHHEFINICEDEEVSQLLSRVNDALCNKPKHYENPKDELAGAWVSLRINAETPPVLQGPHRVIVTGFVP